MNDRTTNQNGQPGASSALARSSADIPRGLDCIPQIRFSSDHQFDSYSAERQDELVKEICNRFDWTYNEDLRLEDLGVSASAVHAKTGVPHILSPEAALGALLEKWEKGKIDLAGKVMGSESVNRFLRLTLGVATSVFWKLVRKGLSFYFINDNLFVRPGDENNLEKQLIMLIKFDASHQMASELSKRILDTLEIKINKAQQGQALGWASLPGYIVHRETPTPHFEWDTVNYPTLMRLVGEALDPAGRSLHSMAINLNKERVPTFKDGLRIRQGKKSRNRGWTAIGIRRILISPALRGTFHIKISNRNRDVKIENYFVVNGKPAVTQEQWVQLQARFLRENIDKDNPKGAGGGSSPDDRVMSLFPGLVKCGVCGKGMKANHYNSGKRDDMTYRRWLCQGMTNHSSACHHPIFYCDPLEAHFFTSYLRKGPDELSAQRDEHRKQKLDAARVELTSVSEQIVSLLQKQTNPDYKGCEDEIDVVLAPLRDRKELLKSEIAKLDLARTPASEDKTIQNMWDILTGDAPDIDALLSNAEKFLARLHDNSVRRRLLGPIRAIISKIEINADTHDYQVTLKGGLTSGWMSIAIGMKAMSQMHRERNQEFRQRASARTTEWHKHNKLSPESIARSVAKRAATQLAKSPEEVAACNAKISAAMKARKPELKRKAREKQSGLGLSRNTKVQLKRWAKGMAERRKAALKDPAKAEANRKSLQAGQRARFARMTEADRAKLRAIRKAAYLRWKEKQAKKDANEGKQQ